VQNWEHGAVVPWKNIHAKFINFLKFKDAKFDLEQELYRAIASTVKNSEGEYHLRVKNTGLESP
jgi:hypothetical protein